MKLLVILGLSFDAFRERRLRSALTVIMVVIGSGLVTSLDGMNAGLNNFVADQLSKLGANVLIVQPSSGASPFSFGSQETPKIVFNDQTVSTLRGLPGVKDVIPVIQGLATLRSAGLARSITIIGIDQAKLHYIAPKISVESGSLLQPFDLMGIVLGHEVAHPAGQTAPFAAFGQTVTAEITISEGTGARQNVIMKTRSFQVKGTLDEKGSVVIDTSAFVSLPAANAFFQKGGAYTSLRVVTNRPDLNEQLEAKILALYGKNIGVTSPKTLAKTINEFIGTFTAFFGGIAAVSMLVGGIGIITTLFTSVMERTREIGLLKALGFTKNDVMLMFLFESSVIGAIGGLLGIIVGIGGAEMMTKFTPFLSSARNPERLRALLSPAFSIPDIALVWVAALGLSALAGFYPAWRASRLSPMVALRKE